VSWDATTGANVGLYIYDGSDNQIWAASAANAAPVDGGYTASIKYPDTHLSAGNYQIAVYDPNGISVNYQLKLSNANFLTTSSPPFSIPVGQTTNQSVQTGVGTTLQSQTTFPVTGTTETINLYSLSSGTTPSTTPFIYNRVDGQNTTDSYQFTLDKPSDFAVRVSSNSLPNIQIFVEYPPGSQKEITSKDYINTSYQPDPIDNSFSQTTKFTMPLDSGTYYIQIEKPILLTSVDYGLRLSNTSLSTSMTLEGINYTVPINYDPDVTYQRFHNLNTGLQPTVFTGVSELAKYGKDPTEHFANYQYDMQRSGFDSDPADYGNKQQSYNGNFIGDFTPIASFDIGLAGASAGLSRDAIVYWSGKFNQYSARTTTGASVDTSGEQGNNPKNVPNIEAGIQYYRNHYAGADSYSAPSQPAQTFDSAPSQPIDYMPTNTSNSNVSSTGVSYTPSGVAGQAFRIYKAAFDRMPDASGLSYWQGIMNSGESLNEVAQGFMQSAEFINMYGTNPTAENFVTKVYNNVLHRAPEASGYNYWVGVIHAGSLSQAGTLAAISESTENQAAVLALVGVNNSATQF